MQDSYLRINPMNTSNVQNLDTGKNLVQHKANYSKDKKVAVIDDFFIKQGEISKLIYEAAFFKSLLVSGC